MIWIEPDVTSDRQVTGAPTANGAAVEPRREIPGVHLVAARSRAGQLVAVCRLSGGEAFQPRTSWAGCKATRLHSAAGARRRRSRSRGGASAAGGDAGCASAPKPIVSTRQVQAGWLATACRPPQLPLSPGCRDEEARGLTAGTPTASPSWSPDGTRIATSNRAGIPTSIPRPGLRRRGEAGLEGARSRCSTTRARRGFGES